MLDEIVSSINSKIPTANAKVLTPPEDGVGDSSILVDASSIKEVNQFLRNHEKYPFPVLQVISGVDYVEYLEVCYMIASFDLENPYQVILKTQLKDRENPELETVTDIWAAADWQERECFDMIGVRFKGHPDHRRILCPDDWEGFPLRKDYKVQENYRGMEVNPDSKMNLEEREFIERQKQMEEELLQRSLKQGH